MTIERIFHCDAPDCEGNVRTVAARPNTLLLFVTNTTGGRTLHFCSWDCAIRYGAAQEPVETIPWDEQ